MKTPASERFTTLSTHFQQLDLTAAFAGQSWRLYHLLLQRFAAADWPATLRLSHRHLASALDVTERTLRAARLELMARGVLRWQRSNQEQPAYWELVLPDQPTRRPRDPSKRPAQRVCAPD